MKRNLKITILGDILCDYEVAKRFSLYQNRQGKYDFRSVFEPLYPFLSSSDIVIANLETPISIDNQNLTNSQWQFFSPFEFAQAVYDCGVKCVSTANNHCLDRGISGIESTIKSLDNIGLHHFGTRLPSQSVKPSTYSFAGIKLGLLAFTYGTNAVSNHEYLNWKNHRIVDLLQEQEGWFDKWNLWKKYAQKRPGGRIAHLYQKASRRLYPENSDLEWFEQRSFSSYRMHLAKKQIASLKKEYCDLIIAQIHVGGQYNLQPSKYTRDMISWFLEQGCNVAVGNHEHVVHGFDFRKATSQLGTYAIGNCFSSAGTLHPPYDRYADHSIALHIYWDTVTKQVSQYTFSVLQTVKKNDDTLCVWPAFDYLQFCATEEKVKQREQLLKSAELFSGIYPNEIQSEYEIYKF